MSLANKVAIVTGASSGIGAAIAIKFTEEGAKVTIVGRNTDKLKNVAELCQKCGATPLTVVADVSKDVDAQRIVTDTIKFFGRLDILVNNAGIGDTASIMQENVMEVFDKIIGTNLRAAVYLTHLSAKHIVETKGNIINISSIAAHAVLTKSSFSYSTSKAGLDHFTRNIALELGAKGIRVNAINPGPVNTEMFENMGVNHDTANCFREISKKFTVLERVSDPEEIGDLAVFLASDKAKSITGATIVADNGSVMFGTWNLPGM